MSERVYEVVEPMEACNIFMVKASSREDAIERVRAQDHEAILYVDRGDVHPSMRRWSVRWMRGWRP